MKHKIISILLKENLSFEKEGYNIFKNANNSFAPDSVALRNDITVFGIICGEGAAASLSFRISVSALIIINQFK